MKIHKHKTLQRIGSCKMCGQCCKNLALEIETSAEPNGHSKAAAAKIEIQKEINKYIKKGYKDVEASRVTWLKGNDFKFTLTLTCPHLKGNKCVIHSNKGYGNKPDFCRKFPEYGVDRPKNCGYRFKRVLC